MIQTLNYSLFSSDEFYSFALKTIALVEEKKAVIPAVVPFLTKANAGLVLYQGALEREAKNPLIKIRTNMDEYRIKAFLAFRKQVESASSRRKEGVADAAHVLIEAIRKYVWYIQPVGQKVRTTYIINIISDLKTKHAAELALTGSTELLEELEQAETDYETANNNVSTSEIISNEPTVSETRPTLSEALRQMSQMISLQETAAPSAEVTALITALNNHITASLTTVKASDTRAENAKKTAAAETK